MHNYSTLQIESIAILILFFFYFIFKIRALIKNVKEQSLLKRNRTIKKLKRLSWDDFEVLCMELFEQEGWRTKGNTKKGADGGVDIWMKKRGTFTQKTKRAIVQCKRYDDAVVGIKIIREMYGLMHEHEVEVAYVVTSSRFTKECYKFVKGKEMVLIDGEGLVKMINKH